MSLTPYEYKEGIAPGNSIAGSGFGEHFVIKRYGATNGTDFSMGSRISFKITDTDCLLHPDQMFLKWRPLAKAGAAKYTGTSAVGALSGATSAIKTVTMSIQGKNIESIQNYNRFVAQEYINSSLEHKVYLAKTEGVSHFINGVPEDNRQKYLGGNNGVQYVMHQLNTGLRGMSSLELPLIPSGIDLELLLTTDIREIYPVPDTIDGHVWQNVELICVCTRPSEGFWRDLASKLQRGDVIDRPIQTVRYQAFQGNNSSSFTLNVDSGVVKSVSSVLVLGNNPTPSLGNNQTVDKLSYSDDLGIRAISFNAGGKRVPEGKSISYSPNDPELYCLGFRGRNPENLAMVPSMYLFDYAATIGTTNTTAVKGWGFRFSMKDSLSAYGDGLRTLTGTFGITLSTVPEAPDFNTSAPATLSNDKSFDVFYVTDNVLKISAAGVRISPVF